MRRCSSVESSLLRRVSISELPMLTRAGTVEIELLYFKLYARYYAKRLRGACRAVGKALKWTVIFILFLPMLPSTAFFILADKFTQAFREEGIFMENEECKVSEDAGKVYYDFGPETDLSRSNKI